MPKIKDKITFEKKKRANTGCLRGILYFILIIAVSASLAFFAWDCINDVLALVKPDDEVTLTIPENYTIPELSRMLKELEVIDKAWLFTFFCNYAKAEESIQPNTEDVPSYTIKKDLDYNAIVRSFRIIPVREEVSVRIIEGKNLRETLEHIAGNGVSDLESLYEAVIEGEFGFEFLEGIPSGPNRLEGYLYPDTYIFFTDSGAGSVLSRFLSNFNRKLPPQMWARLDEVKYTLHEIVTVASMVQLEAATVGEMRTIAGVIFNRLENWTEPLLQIDATLVYMIGNHEDITQAEIGEARSIDNPYNTYMYQGLPPGPICSPTVEAIRAALYPEKHSYYFYALHKNGTHSFSRTREDHNRFINSSNFYYN